MSFKAKMMFMITLSIVSIAGSYLSIYLAVIMLASMANTYDVGVNYTYLGIAIPAIILGIGLIVIFIITIIQTITLCRTKKIK